MFPLNTVCISDCKASLRIRTLLYLFFFFCWRIQEEKKCFYCLGIFEKESKNTKMFTSEVYLCFNTVRKKGTGKAVFPTSDLSCNTPPVIIFRYFLFLKSTHQYCYKTLPGYSYRMKPSAEEPGGPAVLVKAVSERSYATGCWQTAGAHPAARRQGSHLPAALHEAVSRTDHTRPPLSTNRRQSNFSLTRC